jgi:5S rRNA maturation endonuclease (ribonuclease M5)
LRSQMRRQTALKEMETLLVELPILVDTVLIEGPRDTKALRSMGYVGVIEALSRTGVNDFDLSDELASKYSNILLLLDFDEEGLNLNNHFTQLLEMKGVKVEYGLRKEFSKLMAEIGVYAIESLDNIRDDMDQ